MKQDFQKIKNRREFLKDGLRTVLFGGLAFTGLFLGLRGYSRSGGDTSCVVNLPCRSCSKLFNCQEPKAINARVELRDSEFSAQM